MALRAVGGGRRPVRAMGSATVEQGTKAPPKLRLGTRGSELALTQARQAKEAIERANPNLSEEGAVSIEVIKTTGDQITDKPLADAGGKGLFVKELDEALLDGRVDIAVHSMKDVPTIVPDGIELPVNLPREDVRDAFISRKYSSPSELPSGAVVGTSSLRRQTQLAAMLEGVEVVHYRGNVHTRLRKLDEGQVDATMLAFAGLRRLGLADQVTSLVEPDVLIPACSQGAIGIACRTNDDATREAIDRLNDWDTHVAVTAERAFLYGLNGSCTTPVGGHARRAADGSLRFDGVLARLEWNGPGEKALRSSAEAEFSLEGAREAGARAAQDTLSAAPAGFLDGLLHET